MDSKKLGVSRFRGVKDATPRNGFTPWDTLARVLTTFDERDGKEGPLWSPATFKPGQRRSITNVTGVSCLVADLDNGADLPHLDSAFGRYHWAIHTTHSYHWPDAPKMRWVIPLHDEAQAEDWPDVWERFAILCAMHKVKIDRACKDCSRMYFLPSCKPGAERLAYAMEGEKFLALADLPAIPPQGKPKIGPQDFPHQAVTAEDILAVALKRAQEGNRSMMCLWLACQLRDNGHSQDVAHSITRCYASRVPQGLKRYTAEEAAHTVASAYQRPARKPWTAKAGS